MSGTTYSVRRGIVWGITTVGICALIVVASSRGSSEPHGKDFGCVMAVGASFSPGGRYENASLQRMQAMLDKCPESK